MWFVFSNFEHITLPSNSPRFSWKPHNFLQYPQHMFNKSSHRSLHHWFHGEPLIFEGTECAFPPNWACFCFERQWSVFIFLALHMSTTLPSTNYFPRPKFQLTEMFFNGSHVCSSSSLLIFSKLLLVLIHLWRLQKYTQLGSNSNIHSCNDILKIYSVLFYSNTWTVFGWPMSSWSHMITNHNSQILLLNGNTQHKLLIQYIKKGIVLPSYPS